MCELGYPEKGILLCCIYTCLSRLLYYSEQDLLDASDLVVKRSAAVV